MSLEVIWYHWPHGLCEVGYKIRQPCVCLSPAYPTSYLPAPVHYQRCVLDACNLLLDMIDIPTGCSSAHSDRLIPYPVSPLGFSSSLSPCLKGDRWGLE